LASELNPYYKLIRDHQSYLLLFVRELMKLDEAGAADREERKKEMERVKSAR
jgi:hypothetical protein